MKLKLNKVFVLPLALAPFASFLSQPALAQAPSDLVVVNNWNTPTRTYTGRLEVFRIGSQTTVEHNWQLTPGGAWSGWNTYDFADAQVSGIAVGQNSDGRLELFVDDTSHVPRHSWQTATGWNGSLVELGFGEFGGSNQIETPVVSQVFALPVRSSGSGDGQSQDGHLAVFANWPSIQSSVLHAWQVPFGGTGGWLGWTDIEDNFGPVAAVAQNTDGRLEIFTEDGNGVAWHFLQQQPNGDSLWFPLQFLGNAPALSQLVVGQNADGRLEAFGVTPINLFGNGGSVYHLWQTQAGVDTSWGDEWFPLSSGFHIKNITVGQNSDGRLEIFAVTNHGTPLHAWQLSAGGAWNDWNNLGAGNFTANELVVGQNLDGRLEVFNKSGAVVSHIWQDPNGPNGGWSNWTTLN